MTSPGALARLRAAVAQHAASQPWPRPQPAGDLPPIDRILRGEWRETEEGLVFLREDWFPLDHAHGALPLSAALDAPSEGIARLLRSPRPPNADRLAFFDIETTGLAGGTGTYIVLAGVGVYEEGAFRLRQYFLADLAGERAMLTALRADLAERHGIVSYNGRAFDVPCLASRLTLNRVPNLDVGHHVDLLHPVRRLFQHRMPGCRLAEAEHRLLRMVRHEDIAGALIPAMYAAYVRAGQAAPLRAVFQHNAEDVLSLVGVLARVAALVAGDPEDPEDAAAVARWWELEGDHARALPLYERALPWLEGGDDWAWVSGRFASLCRRFGRYAEAAAAWRALARTGDRAANLNLAKHLEHRERDFEGALDIVQWLQPGGTPEERAALELRERRLKRRLAKV